MTPAPPTRRHDLDWLRVFACYLLIPFHVGMVFNPAPFFHVRNDEVSFAFLVLCGFISLWHMPLLFLLAGWSAFASLQRRGASGLLGERGRKLAVPLLVGCVLLAPGIKYFELRSGLDLNHEGLRVTEELQESFRPVVPAGLPVAEPFDETFVEFLPTFFTRLDRFTWSHLWFLAYLLAFTLLYLPWFARVARGVADPVRVRRWWVYAPILPRALSQVGLRPHWPGPYNRYNDWANFSFFSTFLVAGFYLARHPALERAAHEERKRALTVALAAMAVLLAAVLGAIDRPAVLLGGTAVAGWCFVVALLGFANARVSGRARGLAYLTESAFPVYVLHQPVIVFLGYGVVQLPLGIAAKFALLLVGSFVGTVGLYHFLVRPLRPARLLLGMKSPASGLPTRASGRRGAALERV
jgi:peptidoglycan/LPS O-acetylase OafA/YrhL